MGFQKSPILPNKLSYFVSKVDEKSGSGRRASRRAMTILSIKQFQVPARCADSEQCVCCGGVGACS